MIFSFVTVDRLALIRQQREEAAKRREEEKAGAYLVIFACYLIDHFIVLASALFK
jgi:hypothetical protein